MYVSVVIVFQRILNSSKYLLTKILYMCVSVLTIGVIPTNLLQREVHKTGYLTLYEINVGNITPSHVWEKYKKYQYLTVYKRSRGNMSQYLQDKLPVPVAPRFKA